MLPGADYLVNKFQQEQRCVQFAGGGNGGGGGRDGGGRGAGGAIDAPPEALVFAIQ